MQPGHHGAATLGPSYRERCRACGGDEHAWMAQTTARIKLQRLAAEQPRQVMAHRPASPYSLQTNRRYQ